MLPLRVLPGKKKDLRKQRSFRQLAVCICFGSSSLCELTHRKALVWPLGAAVASSLFAGSLGMRRSQAAFSEGALRGGRLAGHPMGTPRQSIHHKPRWVNFLRARKEEQPPLWREDEEQWPTTVERRLQIVGLWRHPADHCE